MKVQEINLKSEPQMKKTARAKKKFIRRLFWLKFILILLLFAGTLVLLALTPMFNITQMEVRGNKHSTREDILGATDLAAGRNGFKTIGSNVRNILTLRYGKAEENILKSDPYIKQAVVRYVIPNKVVIDITERIPVCTVPYLGTNLLMDREGYIVDTLQDTGNRSFPAVKGLNIKSFAPGKKINVDKPEALDSAIKVMEAMENSDRTDEFKIYGLLKWIDVSDVDNIRLLIDSRITVNIGDLQDIKYRIIFLKRIYTGNLKKEDKGYLDFTSGTNPRFISQN